MEESHAYQHDLNLIATELRLGLPGTDCDADHSAPGVRTNKRSLFDAIQNCGSDPHREIDHPSDTETSPVCKAQIVGWPPVGCFRKNSLQLKKAAANDAGLYVKVSMDGAPYLRKIDLQIYDGYLELLKALEKMFKITIGDYSEREGYKGSAYAPTYEDRDSDWMLVGDVPWCMFVLTCKKLRIMKGSETKGLFCGA